MRRRLSVFAAVVAVATATTVLVASQGAAAPANRSFQALSGSAASGYTVPADMRLVRKLELGGLTYERYQQVYGAAGAAVLNGQVTIHRSASGAVQTVVGSHYADVSATNSVKLSKRAAAEKAQKDVGAGKRSVRLMIDADSGRYFYRVETRRLAARWIHWIDAGNGKVLAKLNAIQDDHGTGVKGDTKDMNGGAGTADDLTVFSGGTWNLMSSDLRQFTSDARNTGSTAKAPATDTDNHWTFVTPDRTSPGQPALVDAHYYANVTDDYYQARQSGFDFTDCYPGGMELVAHYGKGYDNAFWNGKVTVYGDGSGVIFRELSGGLDVVAHENTHAVTQCTSDLVYRDESGALNESFSDMLGNSAEFFAAEARASNCVRARGQSSCADWTIGEDVYLPADAVPGFRNMGDPEEDADPDDYSELFTGSLDRGGVHINSGISNHAYYLLVNGGMNASCAAPATHNAAHCGPGEPVVTGIGLAAAERIMFVGLTSLTENATFCNARKATEAAASALFGAASQQRASTTAAWDAVGVPTAC